jgi:hypothetical protein
LLIRICWRNLACRKLCESLDIGYIYRATIYEARVAIVSAPVTLPKTIKNHLWEPMARKLANARLPTVVPPGILAVP